MGRKPDPSGIGAPISYRPDAFTRDALAKDLAAMRARNPRATATDVHRSWARTGNRQRYSAHLQELVEDRNVLREQLQAALATNARIERRLAGYEHKDHKAADAVVAKALRLLRNPANVQARDHLAHLIELEASSLTAVSPTKVLQAARDELESWQDLLDRSQGQP